jgi:hypothetical protein
MVTLQTRTGLTLRQNKHVLRASIGKGALQKTATMPDFRLKNTHKIQRATSSFTEARIIYSETRLNLATNF